MLGAHRKSVGMGLRQESGLREFRDAMTYLVPLQEMLGVLFQDGLLALKGPESIFAWGLVWNVKVFQAVLIRNQKMETCAYTPPMYIY